MDICGATVPVGDDPVEALRTLGTGIRHVRGCVEKACDGAVSAVDNLLAVHRETLDLVEEMVKSESRCDMCKRRADSSEWKNHPDVEVLGPVKEVLRFTSPKTGVRMVLWMAYGGGFGTNSADYYESFDSEPKPA
jgi:hypothetical protein